MVLTIRVAEGLEGVRAPEEHVYEATFYDGCGRSSK